MPVQIFCVGVRNFIIRKIKKKDSGCSVVPLEREIKKHTVYKWRDYVTALKIASWISVFS